MAEEPTIELPKGSVISADDQIRGRTNRFVRTYANSVAVSVSTWDIALTFGDILGKREEDNKTVVEETAQIILTREIAKALAGILLQKIHEYEKEHGEIKIPVSPSEQEIEPSGSKSK